MIRSFYHLTQRSAWGAGLKSFFFLLGFITLYAGAGAQCLQMQPNTYYSRMITSTYLSPGSHMQSDYDVANNHIYIPSTIEDPNNKDAFLARIHGKGYMDNGWGNRYPFSGNERLKAVKMAQNGDIIAAGTTKTPPGTGSNAIIFVMRIKNDGTFLWGKYFDQGVTDVDYRVVLTETINKDIVVAASSVTTNDHILIRLYANGTMDYYDDHALNINNTTNRSFTVINAITATSDNGYVIVGCTGHDNFDFYAAVAIKFDAGYVAGGGGGAPNPAWGSIYLHKLSSYDLTGPHSDRSSTVARGVMEDPGTDKDIIVVGYRSDHDNNFAGASDQDGFIWILRAANGVQKSLYNFEVGGSLVTFNNIGLDKNQSTYQFMVTGSIADMGGNSQTLLANIDYSSGLPSVTWTKSYNNASMNAKSEGFDVFYKNYGGGIEAYFSVGISDDNSIGFPKPHVIAVDQNGDMGGLSCPNTVTLDTLPDDNDTTLIEFTTGSSAHPDDMGSGPVYYCEGMASPCGSLCEPQSSVTTEFSRVLSGHIDQLFLKADGYFPTSGGKVYVPATYNGGTGASDILWSQVDVDGTNAGNVDFSNQYTISSTEKTRAIKRAGNGDMLIAGTTVNNTGGNILFLMRTTASGGLIWSRYYDQNYTNVTYTVLLTETTGGDIVVAASSGTGTNSNILLRVQSNGTLLYYNDRPVYYTGNSVQYWPVFKDITATYDNGFVVVGSGGHNYDYISAVAYKYDAAYPTISPFPTTPTLNWDYRFRRNLPGGVYNLNNSSQRSTSEAQGVFEEPGTYNITIVGNTGNSGPSAYSATFQYGLLVRLNSAGVPFAAPYGERVYFSSYQVDFNDVIYDGNDYVITGDAYQSDYQWYHTLLVKLDGTTLNTDWAYLYGNMGMHRGFSIFEDPNTGGYVSVGVTNYIAPEFYTTQYPTAIAIPFPPPSGWGVTAPHVLAVDGSGLINGGNFDCYASTYLGSETITNSAPSISMGTAYTSPSVTSSPVNAVTPPECIYTKDRCTGLWWWDMSSYTDPDKNKDNPDLNQGVQQLANQQNLGMQQVEIVNGVKLYPNPATDRVNVEITSGITGAGQITVMDVSGRTVSTRNINMVKGQNKFEVDLSDLAPGIYLVKVSDREMKANFPVSKVQKY